MKILFKNINIAGGSVKHGNVLIENDVIAYVGVDMPEGVFDRVIDGKDKVLMPGLVNTHTHSPMTLLRNYADGYDLDTWLNSYIFPVEDQLNGDDVYAGTMLAICEMLAGGTTCFADMYYFMDKVAQAAYESGIKANIGRCLTCFGDDFTDDVRIRETYELYAQYNNAGGGRIRFDLAPHSVYLTTPAYLEHIASLKQDFPDCGVHIHLSETIKENTDCVNRYSMTPTELISKAGLLSGRTILAHCVHLTDNDIDILSKTSSYIAHSPSSNLKLASGIANIKPLLEKCCVTIGTDGASSNNNLDMFEEMHIAALLAKGANGLDPSAFAAEEVIKSATENGAKALGRPDTGVIEPGKKADIVMVDLSKPHNYPIHNTDSNIVYSASASDVCMTMVDGKILYENGEYSTIDIEKVKFLTDKSFNKLFKK